MVDILEPTVNQLLRIVTETLEAPTSHYNCQRLHPLRKVQVLFRIKPRPDLPVVPQLHPPRAVKLNQVCFLRASSRNQEVDLVKL